MLHGPQTLDHHIISARVVFCNTHASRTRRRSNDMHNDDDLGEAPSARISSSSGNAILQNPLLKAAASHPELALGGTLLLVIGLVLLVRRYGRPYSRHAATPGRIEGTVGGNKKKKIESSYYYAHNSLSQRHQDDGVPDKWDGKAQPRLLRRQTATTSPAETSAATQNMRHVTVRNYAFCDEGKKVTVYVTLAGLDAAREDD